MKLTLKALAATAVVGLSLASTGFAQQTAPAAAPAPADTTTEPTERGGLFFEPGITYELGDVKIKTEKWSGGFVGDSTGSANGLGVLARVGFHINDIIFVAADGRYSFLKHEQSINNESSDAKSWTLAPTVGFQTPIAGVRAWGSYIAAGEMDPDRAGDWDFKYKKPQGWLVGAGLRVKAFSVNLEYKNVKYDEIDVERTPGGFTPGDTSIEGEDRALIGSVSFPFSL